MTATGPASTPHRHRSVRANRLQELSARVGGTPSSDLEATMARHRTAKTVDELLAQARAMLPHRPSPAEALLAQANGALLVDIRGDDQRRDGLIPGAIVVPRNSLEWRCDPASQWRHPAITRRDLHIILIWASWCLWAALVRTAGRLSGSMAPVSPAAAGGLNAITAPGTGAKGRVFGKGLTPAFG
jgi:hypothetical protein